MRNPYRHTTCYSLRGFVVGMIVVLGVIQVAMVVMLVDAITTPDDSGSKSVVKLVVGCVGLLVLLLLEVRGVFFLTSGWERLWDGPWKMLGHGVGNLVFAMLYAVLMVMGHVLWGGTTEQVVMGVVGLAVLGDLVGTGVVFMKVRRK